MAVISRAWCNSKCGAHSKSTKECHLRYSIFLPLSISFAQMHVPLFHQTSLTNTSSRIKPLRISRWQQQTSTSVLSEPGSVPPNGSQAHEPGPESSAPPVCPAGTADGSGRGPPGRDTAEAGCHWCWHEASAPRSSPWTLSKHSWLLFVKAFYSQELRRFNY